MQTTTASMKFYVEWLAQPLTSKKGPYNIAWVLVLETCYGLGSIPGIESFVLGASRMMELSKDDFAFPDVSY